MKWLGLIPDRLGARIPEYPRDSTELLAIAYVLIAPEYNYRLEITYETWRSIKSGRIDLMLFSHNPFAFSDSTYRTILEYRERPSYR